MNKKGILIVILVLLLLNVMVGLDGIIVNIVLLVIISDLYVI